MEDDWEVSDLVELLALPDRPVDARFALAWTWTTRCPSPDRLVATKHAVGARRNIQSHYDLSNDFYRLFLDDSMSYSCAVFASPETSLAEAQQAKIEMICAEARPRQATRCSRSAADGALAMTRARVRLQVTS